MSSKRMKLALSVGFLLLLIGCGLYTGEKSPQRTPPSYSGQGFSCVGRIPEHFEKYVSDRLSNEEISSFVSCLQKAFTTFAQLTRGTNATTYAPDEIRQFLHEFFLGDRRISDELMHEFMVLKQAVVGGELNLISRAELYMAVEILEELRIEAIKLKPHLKVLNPRLAGQQDPAQLGQRLLEANEALNSSIQAVTQRVQRNRKTYALANLQKFLTEFRVFVGWEKHFQGAVPAEKWVGFLRVFRQLTLVPADPKVINAGEWLPMLQSFSRWYLVFLQYELGVKERPILNGVGLQNTVQLGLEVFSLLDLSLSRQPGLMITFEQMDELARAVHDLGWTPQKLRAESVNRALNGIVTRMLGSPDIPPSLRKAEGLDLQALSRARVLFYKWAYVQLNLDSRLSAPAGSRPTVPNVQIRPVLNADLRSRLKGVGGSEWDNFLKVRTLMRPLFAENGYRVMLVRPEDLSRYRVRHDFHNLSLMNLWRAATNLVFSGYAEEADSRLSWDSGITSKEMQKFYEDFRGIGIDLQLVDERNANAGARSFLEGNLFTYSADGLVLEANTPKARLRFVETMELFSFLYSGGQMATDFYNRLKLVCRAGPLDVNQRPKLARHCVLERLPALLDDTLTNMPELQQYLRVATVPVRHAYARTLLETAFSPSFSVPEWVEVNELSTLAVVLHYSEAVMTRYDHNRDGRLDNAEIEEAAMVFKGFIKKFAKEEKNQNLSDRQAKAAFYYILTYREMPAGWTDIFWLSYISYGTLSLNRSDLSTVFRVIIARLVDAGKKADPPPPPPPGKMPCEPVDHVILGNCGLNPISP